MGNAKKQNFDTFTGHFSSKTIRRKLESSFVTQTQLLFTTLSNSGRQSFDIRLSDVLVDEACQALETTTLQPIMYECRHCVMVGDPQQLPATILSQYGKNKHFEKSMFERMMQAGCSVRVLNPQYRMHPNIRKYPSNRFYQGKLLDGKNIANLSREFFYSHPLLKPYVLFDVIKGVEKKSVVQYTTQRKPFLPYL